MSTERNMEKQLFNSCLVGSQWYQLAPNEEDGQEHLIEEIFNKVRQTSAVPYVPILSGDGEKLWMTYFRGDTDQVDELLEAMEHIQSNCAGEGNMVFPVDVVIGQDGYGCVFQPIDREQTKPLRAFMPCEDGPRWKIGLELFRRVKQLHAMGLTSNGISRSQLRCNPVSGAVTLWLNHTVAAAGQGTAQRLDDSDCFFRIPDFTVDICVQKGDPVRSEQRDIFSAAVAVFYILLHTHPFIGSDFFDRPRSEYEVHYRNEPKYIFEPYTTNCPGNMALDSMTLMQWDQTVPQLKKLFDQLFMAVTAPAQNWRSDLACWDLNQWIEALLLDQEKNMNASCAIPQGFTREWQRLV